MPGFKDLITKKPPENMTGPQPVGEDDFELYPPRVSINSKQLSEVADWELGKEYTLKVRMVSKNTEEEQDDDTDVYANFEVISAQT